MSPENELELLKLQPNLFVIALFCRSPKRLAPRSVFHQLHIVAICSNVHCLGALAGLQRISLVLCSVSSDVIEADLHYELGS